MRSLSGLGLDNRHRKPAVRVEIRREGGFSSIGQWSISERDDKLDGCALLRRDPYELTMSNKPHPAVGIDLGTTFSAVSVLDDLGRPTTLNNAEGDKLTPSVLLFEGVNVIVGKEAVKAMGIEMERIAECPKRDLGQRVYHKVLGDRQYPPETLQAWILNKLREDTKEVIGPFEKAVVTVPAYFDEVRRKATQDAGYMAGLDVIDIINEPTAAAVAYGFQKGFLNERGEAEHAQKVMVYDLGGGTFDVTIMDIQGNQFRTIATDGDVQLGGRDWDQRIMDYVAEEAIRNHGIDPRDDINTMGRLWRECEDAKRTLSSREKAVISCDVGGSVIRIELTRQTFEEITQDLVDRTAFTIRETLRVAGLEWDQIDRVLLVGGSTRMPSVKAMLRSVTGKDPDSSVSPDEAVAHGAALRAGILINQASGGAPHLTIRNVNSHSLGVVGTDPQTKRRRNAVLIPRNTPLPVSAKRVFKTQKENQKSILVQIVEGESTTPDDCTPLGRCTVRDLPPALPARTPIEVRFRYEENGRLTVKVKVQGTDVELEHEMMRENSLTEEQLQAWREFICGLPPVPSQMANS